MNFLSYVFLALGMMVGQSSAGQYVYQTKTFEALLDHFSFVSNATFPLRYLINNSYVDDERSPILFYTGNEGDIELFAENSGFMWKIAPELRFLIITF